MTHGNLQKYTNPNPLQQWLIRGFLETVTALVRKTSARSVLDVGCAEGFVSHYLSRHLYGLNVIGVDLDVNALARGRVLHPYFKTVTANALALPFPQQSVDLVLCTEVLEHIPYPERALDELVRVTRAYLLLSVPWEPWFRLANLARGKNVARFGDDPEHVNHWTGRAFRRFLRGRVQVIAQRVAFPWQIVLAKRREG